MSTGLDCIGVAATAFRLPPRQVPCDYRLRGGSRELTEQKLAACLARIPIRAAIAGDLLLVEAGTAQFHAVILTQTGYVHADAGLRRVVEVPGAVPWPVISAWRRAPAQAEKQ